MSAPLPFCVADAFADRAFGGNAAAVVLLPPGGVFPPDDWLAKVCADSAQRAVCHPSAIQGTDRDDALSSRALAPPFVPLRQLSNEFNVSNTAFVSRRQDALDGFALRWFTPSGAEATLCGHATLASAHVLFTLGLASPSEMMRFHTRGGLVTCVVQAPADEAAGLGPTIAADFPAISTAEVTTPGSTEAVRTALGAGAPLPIWVGGATELGDLLVVLESPDAVRALQPDLAALANITRRGVIVTAAARGAPWAEGADFCSRWFAPRIGISEDPVTGSAHCALGPFWAARLGRNDLVGYQCSARGGKVALRVDTANGRVALLGRCVTTLRGEVMVPPTAGGAMVT